MAYKCAERERVKQATTNTPSGINPPPEIKAAEETLKDFTTTKCFVFGGKTTFQSCLKSTHTLEQDKTPRIRLAALILLLFNPASPNLDINFSPLLFTTSTLLTGVGTERE